MIFVETVVWYPHATRERVKYLQNKMVMTPFIVLQKRTTFTTLHKRQRVHGSLLLVKPQQLPSKIGVSTEESTKIRHNRNTQTLSYFSPNTQTHCPINHNTNTVTWQFQHTLRIKLILSKQLSSQQKTCPTSPTTNTVKRNTLYHRLNTNAPTVDDRGRTNNVPTPSPPWGKPRIIKGLSLSKPGIGQNIALHTYGLLSGPLPTFT